MGVDDFIARLEMALAAYGFTGDNAIGEFHSCYCRHIIIIISKPTTSIPGLHEQAGSPSSYTQSRLPCGSPGTTSCPMTRTHLVPPAPSLRPQPCPTCAVTSPA